MADKTGIAWTEATGNPVTGCTKVSSGCKPCYAQRDGGRLAGNPKATTYFGRSFTKVRVHPERLEQPLRWRRPRHISIHSMSDLFHENVPEYFSEWPADLQVRQYPDPATEGTDVAVSARETGP